MKKTKIILMVSLFSLIMLLCMTKNVNASATVNSEEDLVKFVESETEQECVLGQDITLTNVLTVQNYNKTINLNGKHLDSPKKSINVKGVCLTFNDSVGTGKYTCEEDYGLFAYENGKIVINGGTFESKEGVLTGNNTKGDMNFEINGGTLTSSHGATVYMPGQVELKITGGTLNGGINVRMGQINITGGTINNTNSANTDKIEEYYGYSGSVWYGSAIAFTTGAYKSDNTEFGNSLNVKISGGTFKSTMGDALSVYALGAVKQNVNISITGGNFCGKDNDIVVNDLTKADFVKEDKYKAVNNENNLTVKGGIFSKDIKDLLSSEYTTVKVSDKEYKVGLKAKDITVKDKMDLIIEDTTKLDATVTPSNTIEKVTYSSSNNTVATVDANGNIKALKAGTAEITVTVGEISKKCIVTVNNKEIIVELPIVDENSKQTQLGISEGQKEQLNNALKDELTTNSNLKKDVEQALNDGKKIDVKLEITKMDDKNISEDDKSKIISITSDDSIAQYFDINLLVTADGIKIGEIHEPSKEIEFTLVLGEDLLKEGRTFYIVRIHNGNTEKIPATLENNILKFKSGKFSTYALAYKDETTKVEDNNTNENIENETEKASNSETSPKTGDSIAIYAWMSVVALIGIITVFYKKNKVNKKH